mgnify:CR=1 FL=1
MIRHRFLLAIAVAIGVVLSGWARAQEAEEGSGRFLTVSQDDLHRVYAHLAARYPGKAWEGFIYEVRLSLASRFPQYIRMEKEGYDGEHRESSSSPSGRSTPVTCKHGPWW